MSHESAAALVQAAREMIAILQRDTAVLNLALDELKRRSASVLAREDRATIRERELEKRDINGTASS